jgi:hypothetical protein
MRTAALLALMSTLVACGTPRKALVADVRNYASQTRRWSGIEAETAETISLILRTQFVDEAEVRRLIQSNEPKVRAHLEEIRAYLPKTPPVRRLHKIYVAGWVRLLDGYGAIRHGFDSGVYSSLAEGREAMMAWRQAMVRVADGLRELMIETGVDPASAFGTET